MTNKKKSLCAVVLLVMALFGFAAAFLSIYFSFDIWLIVLMFILSAIVLGLGIYAVSKLNISKPIVTNAPAKEQRRKIFKRQKKPFLSDEEWKKEDEEDDEMFFIEEHVEDD